jgi:hypothetical protein
MVCAWLRTKSRSRIDARRERKTRVPPPAILVMRFRQVNIEIVHSPGGETSNSLYLPQVKCITRPTHVAGQTSSRVGESKVDAETEFGFPRSADRNTPLPRPIRTVFEPELGPATVPLMVPPAPVSQLSVPFRPRTP